jgi:dTMP kinase
MIEQLPQQPRLITLEGGEGAGKSTALAAVRACLEATGRPVVVTREPGGTPLAEQLRTLVLQAGADAGHGEPLGAEAELLMVFAARAQHVQQVIVPALASGAWVLSDRFTDSSHAYQGGGRGLDAGWIDDLERRVVGCAGGGGPGAGAGARRHAGPHRARARRFLPARA